MRSRSLVMLLTVLHPNLAAAAAGATEPRAAATTLHWMDSVRRFCAMPASLDPDHPRLEYGNLGGRWQAMAGANIMLFGLRSPVLTLGTMFFGFIELSNFTDDLPVPWQSYRASFGIGAVAGSPLVDDLLPRGARLMLEARLSHESDHLAAIERFVRSYTVLPDASYFDNGNFSSYEYVKLRLWYLQPLWRDRVALALAFGGRFFLPSLNDDDRRELRGAVIGEARVGWRISGRHELWVGFFAEALLNDFVADGEDPTATPWPNGFIGDLDGDPLVHLVGELGIAWDPSARVTLVPYFRLADAHGRGLDFPSRRREVGGGLRFLF